MIWVFCRFGSMCFSLHVSKSGKYHNIKIALRVLWHHFGLWFPTPYTFYLCLEIVPTKYIINEAFFYYYIFMEGNTIIVDLKWNDCDFPIINGIRISKEKNTVWKKNFLGSKQSPPEKKAMNSQKKFQACFPFEIENEAQSILRSARILPLLAEKREKDALQLFKIF